MSEPGIPRFGVVWPVLTPTRTPRDLPMEFQNRHSAERTVDPPPVVAAGFLRRGHGTVPAGSEAERRWRREFGFPGGRKIRVRPPPRFVQPHPSFAEVHELFLAELGQLSRCRKRDLGEVHEDGQPGALAQGPCLPQLLPAGKLALDLEPRRVLRVEAKLCVIPGDLAPKVLSLSQERLDHPGDMTIVLADQLQTLL